MTTAYDAPHDELDDGPGLTPTKIVLGLVVLAIVVMWAWIYLFAPRTNPDRLESRAFVTEAESLCMSAHEAIDALGTGRDVGTIEARTEQIAAGTDLTESLVRDLRAAVAASVTDVEDRRILDAWLDDWDFYVEDRRRHVAKLTELGESASDDDLRFILRERAEGGLYTRRIDGLANVNDMASCRIPGDL